MKQLHQDTEKIRHAEKAINEINEMLNQFVSSYNQLPSNGAKIKTSEDLHSAVADPAKHLRDFVMNQLPDEQFGFPVNKAEAIKSLVLPDMAAVTSLSSKINTWARDFQIRIPLLFKLKGSQVVVDEAAKKAYFDVFRIFALTSEEVELFEALNSFHKSYCDLRACLSGKFSETHAQAMNITQFTLSHFISDFGINWDFFRHVTNQKRSAVN